ncbi:MAG: hypothetical protein AAB629_01600 [Patescibacteria group bacterium]
MTTIYLALRLLEESSGSSLDYSKDTTLHRGKDFAVAPRMLPYGLIPKDSFIVSNECVTVRTSRHYQTGVTRYPISQ